MSPDEPPPADAADGAAAARLKTVLLADICDSTAIVEKLGDAHAADLFRDHDRLVLRLQQQWHGRLIDRSDGLLMLFERPVEGAGFALDYLRGLDELGRVRDIHLTARAGLHVGEVLTWHNSEEAVRAGAKPVDVEGLAKPMAARLMALARPGQILLSAVAESLASRASAELEQDGRHLVWKLHGRWRFKGIPQAQDVYEVGEVGRAPLRAPAPSAKAWRDLPLWRRPAALAAEVLLLAGIGLAGWLLTRPQPAIAFNERDWVVMGDVRNLTGEKVLDDSLQQAFRISLEQSRHVNLLGDLKVRDTLKLMRRRDDAPLDRATASEVAIRDGARAVLLPTVAEVGGRVKVSLEVVDPATQTTVYAESASSRGLDSVLGSVDAVTSRMRGHLGEKMQALSATSTPLPQVTTSNLDALRSYALGQQAYVDRQFSDAVDLYKQALQLDPQFALACMGVFRAEISQGNYQQAEPWLRRAIALRNHLAMREQLFVDAWAGEFSEQPALHAPGKWKALATTYPDFGAANARLAWWQYTLGHYEDAYQWAGRASSDKEPQRYAAFDTMARARLAQNHYDEALALFAESEKFGRMPLSRRHASALLAARRQTEADAAMAGLRPGKGDAFAYMDKIAWRLDRDDWAGARALAEQAAADSAEEEVLVSAPLRIARLYVDSHFIPAPATAASARALAKEMLDMAGTANPAMTDVLQQLGIAALRVGQRAEARPMEAGLLGRVRSLVTSTDPMTAGLATMLAADDARLRGKPRQAIALLREKMDGSEHFQLHVALRDALLAAGDQVGAAREQGWLAQNRGRAISDPTGGQVFMPMNIVDTGGSSPRE